MSEVGPTLVCVLRSYGPRTHRVSVPERLEYIGLWRRKVSAESLNGQPDAERDLQNLRVWRGAAA